jgi:hypothetical protein
LVEGTNNSTISVDIVAIVAAGRTIHARQFLGELADEERYRGLGG